MATDIDWQVLRNEARRATDRSYAPYSNFRVGAAGVTDDGRVLTGCNVENASYGLSLCAECGLVSNLFDSGGGRFVGVSCCDSGGANLMPCGRCRQLLLEVGGPELLIDSGAGPRTLESLLPHAFSARDLDGNA